MTRNLKGSLLIASMLVVLWTTSSEACHWAAGLASPPRATANRGTPTGAPPATTLLARAATARQAAVTMVAGTRRNGRLSRWVRVRPARLRLRPARLQPGRHRWAGVRAGRTARLGRRRLRAGALTVHRLCDHRSGRPGRDLRTDSGQRRPDEDAAAGYALPAAGEKIRTAIEAAGRHSGGDPAICSSRSNERARTRRSRHQAPSACKSPSPTDASGGVTAARPIRVSSTQLGHVPPKVLQALGASE